MILGLISPPLLAKITKRKIWTRKKILLVCGLLFFVIGIGVAASAPHTADSQETKTSESVQIKPTNTPTPAEKINVIVTSQVVKKVDKKYRYFFDIRNKDLKPFEGSVTINLFNESQKSSLSGDSFKTNQSMDPELGTSVFVDANTGPTSVHGEFGISKFTYVVWVGNDKVNEGEGLITDKFEDLDNSGY